MLFIEIYGALKDANNYLAERLRQKIEKYPPKFENAGMMNLLFERYIGIDYSGAETPTSSLKGLRIF